VCCVIRTQAVLEVVGMLSRLTACRLFLRLSMTWLSSAATVCACRSNSTRAPGSMGIICLSNWKREQEWQEKGAKVLGGGEGAMKSGDGRQGKKIVNRINAIPKCHTKYMGNST